MLNSDKSGLSIFDNFHVDFNLAKWKNRKTKNTTPEESNSFRRFNRNIRGGMSSFVINPEPSSMVIFGADASGSDISNKNVKFFDWLFGRDKKRKKMEEDARQKALQAPNFTVSTHEEIVTEMDPRGFFESVKNSAEELTLLKERFYNYENAIQYLQRTGQTAMLERMNHELEIHRAESQLYAMGFTKVVTEENVVQFAKKICKELRLDWIKNFTRVIPEKVLLTKEKLDEKMVFDNYVIMHYDPYRNGALKTLKERAEEEKDPILFGVILGSNKLYYVADWMDEYCDLTFDKLVETLGEEAINANDISVEIKMKEF